MTNKTAHDNPNETISLFKFQILYLKRCLWFLIGKLFALFLYSGITLFFPIITATLLKERGVDSHHWIVFISLLFLLAIASSLRYYCATMLGERIILFMQRDVVAKIIKCPPSFFNARSHGELFSTLVKDAERIKTTIGISMSIILRNLLTCIGSIYMMFIISRDFFLVVIGLICTIAFFFTIIFRVRRKKGSALYIEEKKLLNIFSDMIKSVMVLQAFNAGKNAIHRYDVQSQKTYQGLLNSLLLRTIITCCVIFALSFGIYIVFLLGSHHVNIDRISGENLAKFLFYAMIFLGTIRSCSGFVGEILQAIASLRRFRDLIVCKLDVVSPIPYRRFPSTALGNISFCNVSFSYPEKSKRSVLKNINFTVLPGETVALMGDSGAGKTSIFSLILRFYDPCSGFIQMEGIDLRCLSLEEIRRCIAWVPQNPTIITASVHDNIAIGYPNATREAVKNAAIDAQAHEFISNLDKGYDTILGSDAVHLSAGQIQRIAIARAILKDASILLLDEMGSALDIENENKIWKVLREKRKGRTTIFASHRLSLVQDTDVVFVLHNNMIVEMGRHAELIKDSYLYSRYRFFMSK
ncbi:ATP-binding cassette domain-containing protein [Candidatus Liberibacter africanus]|uniref:Lipid A ABC exporter family, fused ATPase and inner membrane subunits n=1 Tax=Candidatus Liberibacter africanus PTSAPSY TaxID=1277257 RepID=A0A0G3I5C7_LIBAF|nr:ATP-binding cassette domain-containing protein [Candidatus Liberibacter africanus]AKK20435.1 lipid A ABC exporter family, fused ATPase and inner membrane subunits [Candidatus Liberibacter africanus PTSAPSY]QTP64158.1 ATP-binding cassette domain-containing protein [Candidatus Liberibacter africanus]